MEIVFCLGAQAVYAGQHLQCLYIERTSDGPCQPIFFSQRVRNTDMPVRSTDLRICNTEDAQFIDVSEVY